MDALKEVSLAAVKAAFIALGTLELKLSFTNSKSHFRRYYFFDSINQESWRFALL